MIVFIRNKIVQDKKYALESFYSEILFQSEGFRGNE